MFGWRLTSILSSDIFTVTLCANSPFISMFCGWFSLIFSENIKDTWLSLKLTSLSLLAGMEDTKFRVSNAGFWCSVSLQDHNNKKNAMKKQELVDFSNKHGIDLKMKLIDLLSRNFNYVLYNE